MISRKTKVISNKAYSLLFPGFVFFFYFLQVFSIYLHPAFLCVILSAPFILFGFLYCFSHRLTLADYFVYAYILWNFITGFFTIYNGYPFILFVKQACYSVIPVFFFFIGQSKKDVGSSVLSGYLFASIFCFVCGFIWVIEKPQYYLSYLSSYIYNFNLNYWLVEPRMNSFIGSICVGILASISSWVSFAYLIKSKKKVFFYILFLFCEVASLASFQRFSYAMSFIVFIVFLFYTLIHKKIRKFGIITLLLLIISLCLLLCFSPNILSSFLSKIFSFLTVFSDRAYQWEYVFSLGEAIVFGNGLGTFSHGALGYTEKLVTDGAFINILGETGIIGFSLFFIIVLFSIISFFKNHKTHRSIISFGIVSIFLIASLGSNSFLYPILAPLFWLSLGEMNFDTELKKGLYDAVVLAEREGNAHTSDYQSRM